jgi:hypothetical protein
VLEGVSEVLEIASAVLEGVEMLLEDVSEETEELSRLVVEMLTEVEVGALEGSMKRMSAKTKSHRCSYQILFDIRYYRYLRFEKWSISNL